MRKLIFALTALAALSAADLPPGEAATKETNTTHAIVINHPGCHGVFVSDDCIHGIVGRRICTKWVEPNGKPPLVCLSWRFVPA
jgi:hypothetical protein